MTLVREVDQAVAQMHSIQWFSIICEVAHNETKLECVRLLEKPDG